MNLLEACCEAGFQLPLSKLESVMTFDTKQMPQIPYVDLRGKTLVDLLRTNLPRAQAMVAATRNVYGAASRLASALVLGPADRASHAWLKRTENPYLSEIEAYAQLMGIPGIFALNMSYEWGCTSGAYRSGDSVKLLRVLDWPFPALGKHVMVAHQSGAAGEYYNVTWPGLSGIYQASAPGRFAAAINQAPMRMHGLTLPGDWLRNRQLVSSAPGLPPAHLLRLVFEKARNGEEALEMLMNVRVALPVIYTLTGVNPGQGCVIERLEDSARVFTLDQSPQITTANHFNSNFHFRGYGWRPRATHSYERLAQSCCICDVDLEASNFDWLTEPIINEETRLILVADAKTGRLQVQGMEGAQKMTEVFHLPA